MRLFRLKEVIALEKVKQELFTKKKSGETETKRALENLRMPKVQEIFTTVPSCVIAIRDSLFRKIFSPLFCFKQEKTLRNVSKTVTLYKYDKENKEEAETKSNIWDLNNA